jgi:hypothetical protein
VVFGLAVPAVILHLEEFRHDKVRLAERVFRNKDILLLAACSIVLQNHSDQNTFLQDFKLEKNIVLFLVSEKLLETIPSTEGVVCFWIDLEVSVQTKNRNVSRILFYHLWKTCQLCPVLEDDSSVEIDFVDDLHVDSPENKLP